VSTLDHLLTII